MQKTIRQPNEVRAELKRKGVPIAKWARDHKLPTAVVYGLLSGRLVGTFGQSHKAAVLLGLKDGEL